MCIRDRFYDEKDRLLKWKAISKLLIGQGYIIKDLRKRIEGKQVRVSTITI